MGCTAQWIVGWWAAATMSLLCAQQASPPVATVHVEAPSQVWCGEAFEIAVEVAYDADWFAAHAVPLVRRPLQVPFLLDVPWQDTAVLVELQWLPVAEGEVVQVPVNGVEQAFARRFRELPDGGATTVLRARCRGVTAQSGGFVLEPVTMRYAYADEFREHLLRGREPVDRREVDVVGAAREMSVRPLPEPRPHGFVGVFDELQLTARVDRPSTRVGESCQVELTATAPVGLDAMPPLRSPALPGFVVQGVVERPAPAGSRRFVLDLLAVREGVTGVPPVVLTVFSPKAGDYVAVMSEWVPLRVAAAADPAALPPRVRELIAADRAARRHGTKLPWWVWPAMAIALLGVLAFVFTRRRRFVRDREVARLLERLRNKLELGDAAAVAKAFEQLLSAATGVAPFGIDKVVERLPEPVATTTRAMWSELDAVRFGGPQPAHESVLEAAQQIGKV